MFGISPDKILSLIETGSDVSISRRRVSSRVPKRGSKQMIILRNCLSCSPMGAHELESSCRSMKRPKMRPWNVGDFDAARLAELLLCWSVVHVLYLRPIILPMLSNIDSWR
jgi:hypothetical protein